MAQFVPIGGGVAIQPRMQYAPQQGPSAAEMLALMMQADRGQDRVSAAEALALVLPLMQGQMNQQQFAAQLKQQGEQFTQNLSLAREEQAIARQNLQNQNALAWAALGRQPTPEQRINELRIAQEPEIKKLDIMGNESKASFAQMMATIDAMKAAEERVLQDRSLAFTTEGALSAMGDVDTEAAVKQQAIENSLTDQIGERQNLVADETLRLSSELSDTGGFMSTLFRDDRDRNAEVIDGLIRAVESGDPLLPGSDLDRYGSLEVLENVLGDPLLSDSLHTKTRKKLSQFVAGRTAGQIRQAERDRLRGFTESMRDISKEARQAQKEIKRRARSSQRDILSDPEAELAPMLSNLYGIFPSDFVGPPAPLVNAGPLTVTELETPERFR